VCLRGKPPINQSMCTYMLYYDLLELLCTILCIHIIPIFIMNSVEYQKYCLQRGIYPSLMFGSFFTLLEVAQGFRFTPTLAATNIGGLYLYNVLQCPMEAIHGRQSSLHNAASGAILGYVGVQSRRIGVPFVDAYFFYRYPQISPAAAGAVAYGTIGFLFATLGGKHM